MHGGKASGRVGEDGRTHPPDGILVFREEVEVDPAEGQWGQPAQLQCRPAGDKLKEALERVQRQTVGTVV